MLQHKELFEVIYIYSLNNIFEKWKLIFLKKVLIDVFVWFLGTRKRVMWSSAFYEMTKSSKYSNSWWKC